MFRSILNQLNSRHLLTALGRNYCVANVSTPTGVKRKEINRVTLVGTILDDQIINDYGQKLIKVRTTGRIQANEKDVNKNHVHILHTTAPINFASGQRVFVNGALTSSQFTTPDNKRRRQNIIKAQNIYILNSANRTNETDMNSVDIMATICSDVLNKDEHSVFTLVSHHMSQNSEQLKSDFHNVFVFDKDLCEFVRNNLQKSERIYLRGYLGGNTHTGDDGKKRHSGFIIAENISHIRQLRQKDEAETAYGEE